jgi:8-oxo-dGTP diphosphatase
MLWVWYYNSMAQKVIDLVKDDDVRQLTDKATIVAGHKLWGGHEFIRTFRPDKIDAQVRDTAGATFRTLLELRPNGLYWTCSCSPDSGRFCEHLVATALDAQRQGRGDIYKAAGIILKDRKMLVERSQGKPAFIGPGGRIDDNETARQALVRELKEEFQIDVAEPDLEPFGSFSAEAANHPGQQVHMEVFIVKKWTGEIRPNNEVEEILWLTSDLPTDVTLGSVFAHEVLPKLKQQNLIA